MRGETLVMVEVTKRPNKRPPSLVVYLPHVFQRLIRLVNLLQSMLRLFILIKDFICNG